MSLVLTRMPEESWRDCALRVARKFGLEQEVEDKYDERIDAGDSSEEAAWCACYEWDILEFRSDSHAR